MFNLKMSKKTMKKFWSLMLVALVTLGAAACTENDENVDAKQEAGLSFYAEIANDTRAYIDDADGDKIWETIWESGDILEVSIDGTKMFNFTYDGEKFTCNEPGVTELLGQKVMIISRYQDRNSYAGKRGWGINGTQVENFTTGSTVTFEAYTSFFRYTYNGDGAVTFTVKVADENPPYVFQDGNVNFFEDITISDVKGENFIPFWTQRTNPVSATLSYSIDGVKCKETVLNLQPGKVYNLGTLTESEPEVEMAVIYFSPGVWNVDGAWFAAHVWNGTEVADVKLTDEDADGIYECEVPAAMTNVIFCRMNPEFTEFSWDEGHVWNQTADLEIGVAPENCYYITGWDTGLWTTKGGYTEPERNFGVVGFGGNWDTDVDMTLEGDWYTLKSKEIQATDSFKIRVNDAWDESYGVESLEDNNAINAGETYTLVQGGKNMMVPAGVYDLYFNYATKEFKAEKVGEIEVPVNVDLGIAGSFQGWDAANPVVMTASNDGWYVATGIELYKSDEFKFVVDKAWDESYGGSAVFIADVDTEYTLQSTNSQNIKASKNGVFTIYFNYTTKVFKYECTEEYTDLMVDITIDNKANWSPLYITLKNGDTTVVDNATVTDNKYSVSGDYIGVTLTYVLSNGSKTMEGNVTIAKSGATINLEETIIKLTFVADTSNTEQWFGNAHIHVWGTGTSINSPGWPGIAMTDNGNKTWSINIPSELVGKTINYVVNNGGDWKSRDSQVTISAEGNTINLSSIGIN